MTSQENELVSDETENLQLENLQIYYPTQFLAKDQRGLGTLEASFLARGSE